MEIRAVVAACGVACCLLTACAPGPTVPSHVPSGAPSATIAVPSDPPASTPPAGRPTPRPGAPLVDVPYAADDTPAHRLDLHLPTSPGPWPVVVFLHGGSWLIGDKEMPAGTGYGALRETLTGHGYAVASVNFRPSSRARFPAQLDDVRAALAFLRSRADEWGLDADRLAVSGESSGAHLAMLAALTGDGGVRAVVSIHGVSDLARLGDDLASSGCGVPAGGNAIVAALLGTDPTGAGRAAALDASPVTHAGERRVPTLLIHGTRDCMVPADQSRRMVSALRAAGTPARLELLEAEHSDGRLYSPAVLTGIVVPFLADAVG